MSPRQHFLPSVVGTLALGMLTLLPASPNCVAGDPLTNPPDSESAAPLTHQAPTVRGNNQTRRHRRHRSADRTATHSRRSRQERNRRHSNRGSDARNADPSNRVHLEGSFQIRLGNALVLQGNGSVSLELDQDAIERVTETLDQRSDDFLPLAASLVSVLDDLPEILSATRDILQALSDPKTQQSLRQAGQLLRLMDNLPISMPTPQAPTVDPATAR